MAGLSNNVRGIIFMVVAVGCFTINDSFLKVAMNNVPPFEALLLRGGLGTLMAIPLLMATGGMRHIRKIVDSRVMLRNLFELIAVLGFILGLANVAIADITALSLLAPMFLILGAVLFFGEKASWLSWVLVAVGFAGALMVAQPGGAGFSLFALFGLWNAVSIAARELLGRRVAADVPGLIVATGAALIVFFGAGIAHLLVEDWYSPSLTEWVWLGFAGLFLTGGHYFVFLAFRTGQSVAVAPFAYAGMVWALISGVLVFGTFPNLLAMAGIVLIVGSGVTVVIFDERRRRRMMAAAAIE